MSLKKNPTSTDLAKKRWYHIQNRSRRMKLPYCTLEDFSRFWLTEHICEYCGILEEIWLLKNKKKLEIDRKIVKSGYVLGNIVWACRNCNIIKSDILTYEEMKEIGKKYLEPKWKSRDA